jgi:hypothetical protein
MSKLMLVLAFAFIASQVSYTQDKPMEKKCAKAMKTDSTMQCKDMKDMKECTKDKKCCDKCVCEKCDGTCCEKCKACKAKCNKAEKKCMKSDSKKKVEMKAKIKKEVKTKETK